jgi:ligand-binding sensor domain-containing protein
VFCAAQDKEGFMWFGTESGLSRFDGVHFKNFTTEDGLPDNEIIGIFCDSKDVYG